MPPSPNGQKSQLSKPFSLSAAGSSYLASLERSLTRTIAAQVVAIVVNSILCVSVYIRAIRGRYMFAGIFCPQNKTKTHGNTELYSAFPCKSVPSVGGISPAEKGLKFPVRSVYNCDHRARCRAYRLHARSDVRQLLQSLPPGSR